MTARRRPARLAGAPARAAVATLTLLGAVLLPAATAAVAPAAPAAAQDAETVVQGTATLKWEPAELRVDPGDTVTFRVQAGGPHPVISGDGSNPAGDGRFDAPGCGIAQMTANGATCEVTFDDEGTFPYFCSVHLATGMKGTVVVGEGGAAAPAPSPSPSPTGSPDAPAAATTAPGKPGIYYAGWGLLALGGVLALAAIAGYLRFQPSFSRERR
jgi:plastocyanin